MSNPVYLALDLQLQEVVTRALVDGAGDRAAVRLDSLDQAVEGLREALG